MHLLSEYIFIKLKSFRIDDLTRIIKIDPVSKLQNLAFETNFLLKGNWFP